MSESGMNLHPLLHPKLKYFTIIESVAELVKTNESAISFLEEIGLIPSRQSTAPSCCGRPMSVEDSGRKLNWVWRCSSKGSKKKGSKSCRKTINPATGTFFEGTSCRIEIRVVLAIVICFATGIQITKAYKILRPWRLRHGEPELSLSTIYDYYSYCREVAEVIASHSNVVLGGKGKTVQIDETFLTKRKYHRGRVTEQMNINVLGLYCKEDKIGLFFKVNSKSKQELLPYIQKYVDYSTSRICTDSAIQYEGVEHMFSTSTVHLRTSHNIGESEKSNPANTTTDLGNDNKLLKKSINCSKTPKLLHQHMALYFYRKICLKKYKECEGSQIMQFLLDLKKVYPGIVGGIIKEGLTIKEIDPILSSSTEEVILPPPLKKPCEAMDINEEDDIERLIESDNSDPNLLGEEFF